MESRWLVALKERALRMVAEHRADYPSITAVSKVVAEHLGLGKETVRRWVVQAEIDSGGRPGLTSEEHAEIRRACQMVCVTRSS